MTNPTLPTENTAWGFCGTMGEHAETAWPVASTAIQQATGADADAMRAFLDSRHGRHFADDVANQLRAGPSAEIAIAAATTTWMGWRIGRRTSRATGIPAGLPYLTGFVVDAGIAAEAGVA